MLCLKFHNNKQSHRCSLPKTIPIEDLHAQAECLFPDLIGIKFYLEVSTPSGNVTLISNTQWSHLISQIFPGLIHIQISFEAPHIEQPTKKKLVSPERRVILSLRNKINDGEAITMYGRQQSMSDEDIHWRFDLCAKTETNVALRVEFIKHANQVGWIQCSYILNSQSVGKEVEYCGPYPFVPDEAFHFIVSFSGNDVSLLFSKELCNIHHIPLYPFQASEIDTVILSATKGRLLCESIFQSYSLM